eukprot:scaffold83833_cov28-Tisochrysis_lutea.AAC.1
MHISPGCFSYILPIYFYLVSQKHALWQLRGLTLKVYATWDDITSPSCDFCDAQDDLQDEQHVIFKYTHP